MTQPQSAQALSSATLSDATLAALSIPVWVLDLGALAQGSREPRTRQDLCRAFLKSSPVAMVNPAAVAYHHARNERELLGALERVFLAETVAALAGVAATLHESEHTQTVIIMGLIDGTRVRARATFDCIATSRTDSRVALMIQPESEPSNLLRLIPDMLFELDANGVYIDFAGPADDALFPPHEFLGKSVTETLPHDVADRTLIALQRLRERGGAERFEYTLAQSDGLHSYEARMTALPHGGAAAYVRDITEQKCAGWRLQESEARFRTLADTAPVLLWMTDRDGACTFFSQSWLEFPGQPLEQKPGSGWVDHIHPDDLSRCLQVLGEHNATHVAFMLEYRLRRCDGEYRWFLTQAAPRFTTSAEFDGFIGSCIDITEMKAAQETSDATLHARTVALERATRRLETLNHSIANHVRTQLRAIADSTRSILDRRVHGLDAQNLQSLERVSGATECMDRLVADLLRLAQGPVQTSKPPQ